MSYRAQAIIAEDIRSSDLNVSLNIRVSFGVFETEKEATDIASGKLHVRLITEEDQPCIELENSSDRWVSYDNDIVFERLNEEKRLSMGKPLNSQDPIELQKIKDTIKVVDGDYVVDPQYLILDSDFEPFDNFGVTDLSAHFQNGYNLQNIAYGVVEV